MMQINRLVALLLTFALLFGITPAVLATQAEDTPALPSYYRMGFLMVEQEERTQYADFMIPADQSGVYINAEDLAALSGSYSFLLTYRQCAFYDSTTRHAVMFTFDSAEVISYILGSPNPMTAPMDTVYYEEVAWVPFDYAVSLLGCEYYLYNDGTAGFVQTKMNTLTALGALAYEKDYLAFDWCREVGYDGLNNMIMSKSAATVNTMQGLITGDTYSALLSAVQNDTKLFAEEYSHKIAGMFVTASKKELEAFSDVERDAQSLATAAISDGIAPDAPLTLDMMTDILTFQTKLDTDTIEDMADGLESVFDVVNEVIDGKAAPYSTLLTEGLKFYLCCYTLCNADQMSVVALQRYAEKTSHENGQFLYEYAADALGAQTDAVSRYLDENCEKWVVDLTTTALEKLFSSALQSASYVALGWELASNLLPPLKDTLDSTADFSISELAITYQNDALAMWKQSAMHCFAEDGVDKSTVTAVVQDAYTYLKFSMVARGAAGSCLQNSLSLSDFIKKVLQSDMDEIDTKIAQYLRYIVKEDYGTLLGDYDGDDRAALRHILANAENIPASDMSLPPLLDPSLEADAITVEEAMALVKQLHNKYWDWFATLVGEEELHIYTHPGNILADDKIPCYVIGVEMKDLFGAVDLYAVPYYGDTVWMMTRGNSGKYYCHTDVNLHRITVGQIWNVVADSVKSFLFGE